MKLRIFGTSDDKRFWSDKPAQLNNSNFKTVTMKQPYLIQTGKIETTEPTQRRKGFDTIVNISYMGAAEFEFGALPDSLDRISTNLSKYFVKKLTIQKKTVYMFVNDAEQLLEYVPHLKSLASGKMRTKRGHNFDDVINDKPRYDKLNFWWDIENDIMWWISDDTEFEQRLITVLANRQILNKY